MKTSLIFICLSISTCIVAQDDNALNSPKALRQAAFKNKHSFDSKSCFVELNGGRFFTQTKEVGGKDFFENQYDATWVTHLSFEKGLSKFYFVKGSLSYAQYSMKVQVNEENGASIFYPFKAIGLSAGFGKRILLKNNFNLINLEAGVGINGHTTATGLAKESNGAGRLTDTGDTVYIFNTKTYIDTKLFPTLYLGAAKDFQLTKSFYLSLAYRFNLGMTSVSHDDITFSDAQNTNTPTKLVMNGTSHAVTLGVKYRFAGE